MLYYMVSVDIVSPFWAITRHHLNAIKFSLEKCCLRNVIGVVWRARPAKRLAWLCKLIHNSIIELKWCISAHAWRGPPLRISHTDRPLNKLTSALWTRPIYIDLDLPGITFLSNALTNVSLLFTSYILLYCCRF